jgi:hypothetical protein
MVEPGIDKGCSYMTYGAVLRRRQVSCVLAGRVGAIVAGLTVIRNTGMVKNCGHEGTAGHVADIAILGCRDVVDPGIFADCVDAVMAGITAFAYNIRPAVIDKPAHKGGRVVADTAIGTGNRVG